MYYAMNLAKYIISKCVDDQHPITNLQLQKILYYIQKDFLSRNSPAFSDPIEAWQFGPVVPNVYYRFCTSGAMPISIRRQQNISLEPADKDRIDRIVEEKREKSPWELVAETHKPGGAWEKVYQNGAGNKKEIPIDLIQSMG